jgi:FkbM family methyltransferase
MTGMGHLLSILPARTRLPARYAYERVFRNVGREMKVIRERARHGGVAVDVGAGIGLYAYGFVQFCSRVEAFEPNPDSARHIRERNDARVVLHESALSSTRGEATLLVPRDAEGVHPSAGSLERAEARPGLTFKVPTATLDEHAFRDVSIVKIDVEGHERHVIRGARETLAREHPVLLVEIEQRHLDVPIRSVFDEILAHGYEGAFLDGARLRPLADFDPARHQAFEGGPRAKEYVNNLLFFPSRS